LRWPWAKVAPYFFRYDVTSSGASGISRRLIDPDQSWAIGRYYRPTLLEVRDASPAASRDEASEKSAVPLSIEGGATPPGNRNSGAKK
jgi:hypothetical protein